MIFYHLSPPKTVIRPLNSFIRFIVTVISNVRDSMNNPSNRVKDKKHRTHYREYFNLGIVLRGDVNNLEEIKRYIIDTFVDKGLVKLIKPTYKKEKLCLVNEFEYKKYKKPNRKKRINGSTCFYVAFILRGEVTYLEKIKEYINQGSVEIITFTYEKDKLYIIEESQ